MTNNEKFNQMLNACNNPRLVLCALKLIIPAIRDNQKSEEEGKAEA